MGILDTVLAHQQRQNEMAVERDQKAKTWVQRFNTETKVFARRIDRLNLENTNDRKKFYTLVDDATQRFTDLRNRDEIGVLPAEVIIRLDTFIEKLDDTYPATGGTGIYWVDETPAEEARRKRQLEKEKAELLERREQQVDTLTEHIANVYNALPDDK